MIGHGSKKEEKTAQKGERKRKRTKTQWMDVENIADFFLNFKKIHKNFPLKVEELTELKKILKNFS